MADLCPTCHSKIGTDSTSDERRIQGSEGVDSLNNPVPRWSDDPVFTPLGLNSSPYAQKRTRIRVKHIKELQDSRTAQETELGITLTDFTDLTLDKHISRRHIVELRESTERLLNAAGIPLQDYFKLDDDEVAQSQNPNVARAGGDDPQTEWVDIERGAEYVTKNGSLKGSFTLPDNTTAQSPTLPKRAHFRAIYIEDLRHPISIGVTAIVIGASSQGFRAKLNEKTAIFRNAQSCGIEEP